MKFDTVYKLIVVALLGAILFCLVVLVEHTPTPVLTGDLYWTKEAKAKTPEQRKALRMRIPLIEGEGHREGRIRVDRNET